MKIKKVKSYDIRLIIASLTLLSLCITVALKVDGIITSNWYEIFLPAWIGMALILYLTIIISARATIHISRKGALYILSDTVCLMVPIFSSLIMIVQNLEGDQNRKYSLVLLPLYILFSFLSFYYIFGFFKSQCHERQG